ncbi:MAG: hypothetical protein RIS99_1145 [Bacteroidota bacterium]|jgi:23S rRNA (cytosine1962-C5)-methyltransferase
MEKGFSLHKERKDFLMIQAISTPPWPDYEIIDSGEGEKLERFGAYVTARPEPQAVWKKSLSDEIWRKKADAYFEKGNGQSSEERGTWHLKKGVPDVWEMNFPGEQFRIKFKIALTSFKHVGIFPEQADNWNWLFDQVKRLGRDAKVLNLFAYTGLASLAVKAAKADVTHVDSVKQVISWSRTNMEMSSLDNIRWVVEDAFKFTKNEWKRGKKYKGIILDPPAYGRGPDGEKWLLTQQIDELLQLTSEILDQESGFLLLNLYSMGFSPLISETLVRVHFPFVKDLEMGELFVEDQFNKKLPLGTFCRASW